MKNAAKNKNATIHIPKADTSYNHGRSREKMPQHTQEPSVIIVHSCMLSRLRRRIRRSMPAIHTRYGTRQYKMICPISPYEFRSLTSNTIKTVIHTRLAAPAKTSTPVRSANQTPLWQPQSRSFHNTGIGR